MKKDQKITDKHSLKDDEAQGLDPTDAPRISQNFGTNPTAVAAPDMMGISDPAYRKARKDMGMGVPESIAGKAGHMVGAVGNDINRDASRGVWWLLNAPQAVSDVMGEYLVNKANPDLYKSDNTGVSIGNNNTKLWLTDLLISKARCVLVSAR